ncbi:hypothetical protein [Natrinema gelatinilyticum]|uniref:hypothetical protein n=1 Tax=Natrinema gelatinilyticum TaxID=2961571 RepID=UPI0020C3C654|nr:hypothetical protein [Natrinema gelatinilyticum]
MLRNLLVTFGLVEIVKPEPVIGLCERIGLRNPERCQRRPVALAGARLEGLAFVWLLARNRKEPSLVGGILGVAGLILVLIPRSVIALCQNVGYTNGDDLEFQPWAVPAVRLLGVLYLTVTLLSWSPRRDAESNEGDEGGDDESGPPTNRRLRLRSR